MTHQYKVAAHSARISSSLGILRLGKCKDARGSLFFSSLSDSSASQVYAEKPGTKVKMNSLSFDDPSLDNLDPTLSLNDPSDIDTALLSDIDGERI